MSERNADEDRYQASLAMEGHLLALEAENERLTAEVRRLRRITAAAERVVAKYREGDALHEPRPLIEEVCWLSTVLVETQAPD